MSIATELGKLNTQRNNLAVNLTTKGVTASSSETLAQLVPKVLDITSGGGGAETLNYTPTVISSSTYSTSYRDVFVLEPGTSFYWSASGYVDQWIGVDFKRPVVVKGFELRDYGNRLQDFVLEGSADNSTFTIVHAATRPSTTNLLAYAIDNAEAYQYYRIRCAGPLYSGSNMTMYNLGFSYL